MPQRRSPRTLRDVSHLFLSGAQSGAERPSRRSEAILWIATAGFELNRAHLAAGTAAACLKQGMCVSLMELCGNLPNVGYYFGMEPIDYLAPVIDRSKLVSGRWEQGVRYCFSPTLSSFLPFGEPPLEQEAPHALVTAFNLPRNGAARFFLDLRASAAVYSDRRDEEGGVPDCIIIASDATHAGRARGFLSDLHETFPGALFFYLASSREGVRPAEADESFILPPELQLTWARRTPPGDRFFEEVVTGIFQVLSLRRRRVVGHGAG